MVVSLSQQCKKCAGPAPGTGRRHSVVDRFSFYGDSTFCFTSRARHNSRQPGKFHLLGKSRHWRGLTGLIRQPFSVSIRQAPSAASLMDNPLRLARRWQHSLMNSCSSIARKRAISRTSSSSIHTSPAQRQQAPHRVHSYHAVGLPSSAMVLLK